MKKSKWILSWGMIFSLAIFGAACSDGSAVHDQPSKSATTTAAVKSEEAKKDSTVASPKEEQSTNTNATPAVQGQLKVYYFDVGQGDSIYIQTPEGDDILIDGGNNDKGDDVVRYLRSLHVSDLEVMIATHPDADHIGGLDTVLQEMKVKAVYTPRVTHTTKTYEDFLLAVKQAGLKLKEAKAGINLGLKGVEAKFVAPVKNYGSELNDWSAVTKITYGNNSFLFTGDAPIRSEEDMIASHQDIQADVLKVGHHGAKTSSSQNFLEAVKPKFAIISVGAGNRYGHPTDEVLNRLKQNNIQVFRTDEMKTILALADGKSIHFESVASLTPNHSKGAQEKSVKTVPVPAEKSTASVDAAPKVSTSVQLQASLDNPRPKQSQTIHLTVTGIPGASYTATAHYKSTETKYTGEVGTPLPIRISRAASGYEVVIDVVASANGKTYSTQTSFVPQ